MIKRAPLLKISIGSISRNRVAHKQDRSCRVRTELLRELKKDRLPHLRYGMPRSGLLIRHGGKRVPAGAVIVAGVDNVRCGRAIIRPVLKGSQQSTIVRASVVQLNDAGISVGFIGRGGRVEQLPVAVGIADAARHQEQATKRNDDTGDPLPVSQISHFFYSSLSNQGSL